MRILYLMLIFSIFLNPLAANSMQGEEMSCAEMHQVEKSMESSNHSCCDDSQMQQEMAKHDCETCNDCSAKCHTTCCVFSVFAFSEPIAKELAYLTIGLSNYPTPLQVSIIPPIA
jgi:hypothetical protein